MAGVFKAAEGIKNEIDKTSCYFREAKSEIAAKNLSALKVVSIGGIFVALFFFIITPHIFSGWTPTKEHIFLIPSLLAFSLFSVLYDKFGHNNFLIVHHACILYIVVLLAQFIPIGVFPYPDYPAATLTCFVILMPMIFIIRPWIMSTWVIISSAVFLILACKFKSPICVPYDIFSTIMSSIFAIVVTFIASRLRVSDYMSREEYKRLSRTDLSTGLLNKRSYEARCQCLMLELSKSTPCALLIFDIDNFKLINDTFGHIVGDNIVETIGGILSNAFRSNDLVGRIGGDEFSAYVSSVSDPEMISNRAARILSEIRERTRHDYKIEVTMSVGIAISRRGKTAYRDMYLAADRALYTVKNSSQDGLKINLL
ncbi:MAG: GGDEF domain-containing protein [Oscillospiraceae bacterium]